MFVRFVSRGAELDKGLARGKAERGRQRRQRIKDHKGKGGNGGKETTEHSAKERMSKGKDMFAAGQQRW